MAEMLVVLALGILLYKDFLLPNPLLALDSHLVYGSGAVRDDPKSQPIPHYELILYPQKP